MVVRLLAVGMLAIGLVAGAASANPPTEPAGKMLFVKPVVLRGTLGSDHIQVNLRTKAEFEDGIEGDYFIFGSSHKILLAGEIEGEEMFLEESVNGTDVSGQWDGKLQGDLISGEWQSADGTVSKPFQLRIVRPSVKQSRQ